MSDYQILKQKYELLLQDAKEVIEFKKENEKLKALVKEQKKQIIELSCLLDVKIKKLKS